MDNPGVRRIFLTAVVGLSIILQSQTGVAEDEPQVAASSKTPDTKLSTEIRKLAHDWMQAWTDLDVDKMAELHDPELAYFWRGKPDSAEEFLYAFENFVAPNAPEEPVIYDVANLNVQVVNDEVVIASFNFHERGESEDSGAAVSLVFVHRFDSWKIIHAHESKIRR